MQMIIYVDGVPVFIGTKSKALKKFCELYDDPRTNGKTIRMEINNGDQQREN